MKKILLVFALLTLSAQAQASQLNCTSRYEVDSDLLLRVTFSPDYLEASNIDLILRRTNGFTLNFRAGPESYEIQPGKSVLLKGQVYVADGSDPKELKFVVDARYIPTLGIYLGSLGGGLADGKDAEISCNLN